MAEDTRSRAAKIAIRAVVVGAAMMQCGDRNTEIQRRCVAAVTDKSEDSAHQIGPETSSTEREEAGGRKGVRTERVCIPSTAGSATSTVSPLRDSSTQP